MVIAYGFVDMWILVACIRCGYKNTVEVTVIKKFLVEVRSTRN